VTTGPSGFGSMSDTPTELPGPAPVDGPLGEAIKKRRSRAGTPPSPSSMPRSKDRLPGEEPPTVAGPLSQAEIDAAPAAPPVAEPRSAILEQGPQFDLSRLEVVLYHRDGHKTIVTLLEPSEQDHRLLWAGGVVTLSLTARTTGNVSRTEEWTA
jgi:hypothetical protein